MKKYSYTLDLESQRAPAQMLRLIGEGKRVLEIGCSTGSQTRILRNNLNCQVTGIEIDPVAAEEARQYCDRLIVGDIEKIEINELFENDKFDVITFGDVLEHLRDPRFALEKTRQLLTETGYVVASVPNIAHASIAFELCNGRFDYQTTGLLDDTHIRFFTKRTITRTFEDAGFIVTRLQRSEVKPEHTEFKTKPSSNEERAVLNYMINNNQESLTYQFIVQATPLSATSRCQTTFAIQTATERIRELENQLKSSEQRTQQLESDIAWINSRPLAKLYRFLFS